VPDFCTCGAQLPPDARFCHKCGKPQRDEPLIRELDEQAEARTTSEKESTPPPLPETVPQRISLFNPQAVGVALIAWILSFLGSAAASLLQLPQVISVLWLPAGGLLAVYLYRRRTGRTVTPRNGAQLGWLCGTFGFIMAIFALTLMVAGLSEPTVANRFREQMEANGFAPAAVTQMLEVLHSPSQVFAIVFLFFVVFSVLPTFGGVIGAKLFGRNTTPDGH